MEYDITRPYPAGIYLFQSISENTKTMCKFFSKLAILVTLNRFYTLFWCFLLLALNKWMLTGYVRNIKIMKIASKTFLTCFLLQFDILSSQYSYYHLKKSHFKILFIFIYSIIHLFIHLFICPGITQTTVPLNKSHLDVVRGLSN